MFNSLIEKGKKISLPKGAYVFQQGDSQGSLYLVVEGLLKAYYITDSGKEYVKSFIAERGFIANLSALLADQPCTFNVVALEGCQLIQVSRKDVLALQDGTTGDLRMLNNALILLAQKKERREYEFLCLSAEQRYHSFCEEYSHLTARVSQYDIAHYLGITPVALSRIKNRSR